MFVDDSRELQAVTSEAALLRDALAGSHEALGELLQAYRDYLLLMADQELGSDLRVKASASDLVQDSFLEATRDFEQFTGKTLEQFQGWLRKVLVHNIASVARDYRGTGKRDLSKEVISPSGTSRSAAMMTMASDDRSASSVAMDLEQLDALHAAMGKLPKHYQEVIHWRNYERKTFEEIGQRMERSAEAVRKLWVRALELLQQELDSANDSNTLESRNAIRRTARPL